MEWWLLLTVSFGLLLILQIIGIPIAFSMGFMALGLGLIFAGPRILDLFGFIAYGKVNSYELSAVPLFILMAEVIISSGMGRDLFDTLAKWIGAIRGGLAIAAQIACTLFAACIGTSTGCTAVAGGLCVPELLRHGYDKRLTTGSIAAGGALGILIPPSVLMIIYGILSEQSIAKLFIAGIMPGLMLSAMFVAYILVICSIKPHLGPATEGVTWGVRLASTWKMLPVLSLAAYMFLALYTGIATTTEVAAVGAVASLVICLAYRQLTWASLREALLKTARTTCFILWVLVAASAFGFVLSYLQAPQKLTQWAVALPVSPYVIIAGINILYFILGCIMDPGAIVMVTIPILVPIVSALGFDLVWFGVMIVVNMELANITPPLGLNLFVMKAVAPPEVTLSDITIGAVPFMILDIIAVALVIIFPQIIMWLPSMMK